MDDLETCEITGYCRDCDIRPVEDACQALGSKWNGNLGTFGNVVTFSFIPHREMDPMNLVIPVMRILFRVMEEF